VRRSLRPLLAVLLAVTTVAPALGAELAREDALAALADASSAERRRLGATRLADAGRMDDSPALVAALRDEDAGVRALAERALWQIWSTSGDEEVDRLMAIGIEQITARAGDDAVATFTRIIERMPDFAEGWNKRATIHFLMGDYVRSLADCDEVMKRNPWHFGALSGYGMIHTQLGNPERALEFFERALRINPNLDGVRDAAETLRRLVIQRRRNTI
jgi:tetratricopeptide (TPR) repeat protein